MDNAYQGLASGNPQVDNYSIKMFDKMIFGVRTKKQFYDLLNNLNNIKVLKKDIIKKVLQINENNFFFIKSKNRYNN